MARRHRLDAELVDQGLFATTDEAARAVMAGEVSTDGRRLAFPGEQVVRGIALHVRGRSAFVSRGGIKLDHGITELGVEVAGRVCLDVGCSTGGFTDCLLRRGARSVVAVDVGVAQFSWALRLDERVTLLERTNVKDLVGTGYDHRFELAVCDVSFTSVRALLPAICALLACGATFLTLVKPQFEARRQDVGTGGVVRDEDVRLAALDAVTQALADAGFAELRSCASPITGHKGNVEYLLAGRLAGAVGA